jgi:hypothetical protein
MLYLLVDGRTGATASNQYRTDLGYPPSLHDIAAMDFDINLTPGTWDRRLDRCVPAARNTRGLASGGSRVASWSSGDCCDLERQ